MPGPVFERVRLHRVGADMRDLHEWVNSYLIWSHALTRHIILTGCRRYLWLAKWGSIAIRATSQPTFTLQYFTVLSSKHHPCVCSGFSVSVSSLLVPPLTTESFLIFRAPFLSFIFSLMFLLFAYISACVCSVGWTKDPFQKPYLCRVHHSRSLIGPSSFLSTSRLFLLCSLCAEILFPSFPSLLFSFSLLFDQLTLLLPLSPLHHPPTTAPPSHSCLHGNTTNSRQSLQYSPWGPQDHERVRLGPQRLFRIHQASSCQCSLNSVPGIRDDSPKHPLWQDHRRGLLCTIRPLLHNLVAQPFIYQEPTGPCLDFDILLRLLDPLQHFVRGGLYPHTPVVISGLGAIRRSRNGRNNNSVRQHIFVLAAILPCLGTSTRC